MKTSIKTLSFIAGIALLVSCSKSLTDIGYEASPLRTTDPTSVGRIASDGNICSPLPMRTGAYPYTGSRKQVVLSGDAANAKGQEKKSLYFIQTFYLDLLNNPKFEKLSKKYTKKCCNEIVEAMAKYSLASEENSDTQGWELFTCANPESSHCLKITSVGCDWYKASYTDEEEPAVYIKVIADNKHNPIITGLKNPAYHINIGEK